MIKQKLTRQYGCVNGLFTITCIKNCTRIIIITQLLDSIFLQQDNYNILKKINNITIRYINVAANPNLTLKPITKS